MSQKRQRQAEDADRHVDEEDPLPAEVVDQDATGQRADQRGDSRGGAPHAHRGAPPLRREDPGDRRQGLRGQQGGPDALHHAGGDERSRWTRPARTTGMRR